MALLAANVLVFIGLFTGSFCTAGTLDSCVFLGEREELSLYEDGDVVIGGLFPLHFSPVSSPLTYKTKPPPNSYNYFSSRALRWMHTMTFAIKEINKRNDFLSNITLGFHIRDSCNDIPVSLKATLQLVNGQPESNLSTEDAGSGVSMALLRSLGSFHIPLVSYFASCSCLSNQKEFPTFMRTMPSDAFQIRALIQLVRYFGWTWVGVIGVESDYARFAIQLFLQESMHYGVCAAYTNFYPVELNQHMKTSKVIVNFSGESEMQDILREVQRRNMTGLQWIASEAWATAKSLWEKSGKLLQGTLGFAIQRAAMCKGTEKFDDVYSPYFDVTQLRVSYNVYKAVYLVAHSLQDMSDCKDGKGPFQNGSCLLHYMKRTNFSVLGKEVNFDQNGDPIAYYDLMNWQEMSDGSLSLVKVGFYDASLPSGQNLVINDSMIQWPVGKKSVCSESCPPGFRVARRKGEPICCYDCIPCAEGEVSNATDSHECSPCSEDTWPNAARDLCIPKNVEFLSYYDALGILLCTTSVLGACMSFLVVVVFFKYKDTPIVRANNMELSFLLLVFLAICFLVSLLFIGEPSDWLCLIKFPAFGISFALCISCLLAKTSVVLMAFRARLPGSNVMKWFGPMQQRASVLLGTAVQVFVCLSWLLTAPPHANYNTNYHSSKIIIECVTGSEVGFWCVLGYIGFLACMCLVMAFLARKLPDNFNDAKFITFSMLIFFAVWITFIPVYMSTVGKFTVAVHVFAILASTLGLLLCIFAPKCYILLLRPDKNCKKKTSQLTSQF
uniref:Olfactory receptor C family, x1 n=1 Tax=Oryzias sinensis TaxID=183150 RepID=A0A8C7YNR8_9TELE